MKPKVIVMKFGGTSVGDASCIARTAKICVDTARSSSIVVVVSAMSGVTNRLIEAATFSEAGESERSSEQLSAIRKQHEITLDALIADVATRKQLAQRMETILGEAGFDVLGPAGSVSEALRLLAVRQPDAEAFAIIQAGAARIITVTDDAIAAAMRRNAGVGAIGRGRVSQVTKTGNSRIGQIRKMNCMTLSVH